MLYRDCLNDISSLLKQTYQNKTFENNQILFWIEMCANRLRRQHDEKIHSGAYLHTYRQVPIKIDTLTGEKYIELPEQIFDLDYDGAIKYLTYDFSVGGCITTIANVEFHRTSVETLKRLYFTEEETPRSDNPYFYRRGIDKLYLLGIECLSIEYLEIGIMAVMNPSNTCGLDNIFEFPDELYPILQNYVLNIGKFGLMMPEEAINKGENRTSPENIPIPRTGAQVQPIQQFNEEPQQQ